MRYIQFSLLLPALLLVCLSAACAGSRNVAQAELQQRRFALYSVDGKSYSNALRTPELEFFEDLRMAGAVCNRFFGQAELANNVLRVRNMGSTRMLCGDSELDQLEMLFGEMLVNGAEVELDGPKLTLRQGGHTLVYIQQEQNP